MNRFSGCRLVPGRRASTQTEYVLIAAIVSIAILAGVVAIGTSLGGVFTGLAEFFEAS